MRFLIFLILLFVGCNDGNHNDQTLDCPTENGIINPLFLNDCPVPNNEEFCHEDYLNFYNDVINDNYYKDKPYQHYFHFGKDEGRVPCPKPKDVWPLPEFITAISFYNGHHAPNYLTQLIDIKNKGFNCVRVFANHFNPDNAGYTVFDQNGNLTYEINGLVELMNHCKNLGLVVDLTFWARYEGNLRSDKRQNIDNYSNGVLNTVRTLHNNNFTEKHYFVDVGNEFNDPIFVGGYISEADLGIILSKIRSEFPKLVLTASMTSAIPPIEASIFANRVGFDVLTYHEHRELGKWPWDNMPNLIAELGVHYKKPIFLDEPHCSDYKASVKLDTVTTHKLITAYQGTINGGGKMWCLHHHACWPKNHPRYPTCGIIPNCLPGPELGFYNLLQ